MRKAIQAFLRNTAVDMIHVQHLRMASYALPLGNQPAILDMPDAFSLYWKRRMDQEKSWWARKFAGIEYRRLMAYEARMLKAFPRVLVCSSEDQDYLAACHPDARIDLLPNGVDLQTFKPGDHDYEATLPLLFTGNMDYAPNVDAVVHFVHEILPRIHAQIPDVEFVIAGQRPVKSVLDLASDKVKVTGFVEDLAAVYHSSSILVSPLRFGAGTQNKVLEAMAMGIPVVCSSIGFKGLGISSGEGAFCEEGDEAFANRVVSLLGSSQLRQETGAQGMAVARSKFGWEAIAGRLHELICDTRRLNLS